MINEWLNANYLHLIAVLVGLTIRWGAGQFLANATAASKVKSAGGGGNAAATPGKSRWTKERITKFIALFFHIVAGLLFAFGAYPLAQWLVSWGGGLGGWLSVAFGVVTLAAGWHALHGLIGLVHDMSDGTPDKEAFSAAFMVPTTIPLGWAALVGLFSNPRGAATGVGVVAVSAVTAYYAHKILKKTHSAKGHYRAWMILSTIICAFVGFAHIPALIYLNEYAGSWLPEWATWLVRSALVACGVIFAMIGLGDLLRDWIPEKWSQWAAMYSIPVFSVLTVSIATLQADASTSLHTIFGAL